MRLMLVYLGLNLPSSQRWTVEGVTPAIMDNAFASRPRSSIAAANRSEKSWSKKKKKKIPHPSFPRPEGPALIRR
jgi:hypothetical protein